MAKRKLNDAQIRERVRARRTKGDAFRLDHKTYGETQRAVEAELAKMTVADIRSKWPYFCYDF